MKSPFSEALVDLAESGAGSALPRPVTRQAGRAISVPENRGKRDYDLRGKRVWVEARLNAGTGVEVTIRELAELVASVAGWEGEFVALHKVSASP